jgi:hypothetical protein
MRQRASKAAISITLARTVQESAVPAEAEWISRLRQHTQAGRDSHFGGTYISSCTSASVMLPSVPRYDDMLGLS